MSVINNLPIGSGFSPTNGGFDFERSPGNAIARSLTPISLGDNVRRENVGNNWRLPIPGPPDGFSDGFGIGGGGNSGAFGGLTGLIGSLMNQMSHIFQMLASLLSSATGNGSGNGTQAGGTPGQQAFANASASSTGDPHETFAGTEASGERVDGKWDSMTSHSDLISSDSFDGGYRVSNTVTQPNANGVTMNARVNVATDGGQSNVAINADGSFDVSQFGHHVDLAQGRAVRLNENESVTLNADTSLTISETNRNGGSISTTMRSNGSGGVDVSNDARNVDLGGYLVSKNDGDADPVALAGPQYANEPTYGFANGITPIPAAPPFDSYASYDTNANRPQELSYAAESFEPEEA